MNMKSQNMIKSVIRLVTGRYDLHSADRFKTFKLRLLSPRRQLTDSILIALLPSWMRLLTKSYRIYPLTQKPRGILLSNSFSVIPSTPDILFFLFFSFPSSSHPCRKDEGKTLHGLLQPASHRTTSN